MENTQLSIPELPEEVIASKIYLIRNQKVMFDSDLASLYQVATKRLNEQVKRNLKRFPEDFMFQLDEEEWDNLKSQIATSSWGGRRKMPYVFTEHGVLMLSSVLSSDRAIAVNIKIVRVYKRLKETLLANQELLQKMDEIEKKVAGQEEMILNIFDYLRESPKENEEPRTAIGFQIRNGKA